MDDNSTKFSAMQDEINNAKSTVDDADTEMPKSEDAIKEGEKLERGDEVSPQRKGFNSNISKNKESKENADKKLESMRLSADRLQKK